jgi:hypothetical protein
VDGLQVTEFLTLSELVGRIAAGQPRIREVEAAE